MNIMCMYMEFCLKFNLFLGVEFLGHKACIYAVSVDTDKHLSKIVAKLSIPLSPPSTTV